MDFRDHRRGLHPTPCPFPLPKREGERVPLPLSRFPDAQERITSRLKTDTVMGDSSSATMTFTSGE